RAGAFDGLRELVLPGVGGRITNHDWLRSFPLSVTGVDLSLTVRQSCAGVAPPTLRQLNDGPPRFGTPGVSGEVWGRLYAYSWSLMAYLLETQGKDGYWRLLRSIQESGVTSTTFTRALGVSEEELYAAWLSWSKKRYC